MPNVLHSKASLTAIRLQIRTKGESAKARATTTAVLLGNASAFCGQRITVSPKTSIKTMDAIAEGKRAAQVPKKDTKHDDALAAPRHAAARRPALAQA